LYWFSRRAVNFAKVDFAIVTMPGVFGSLELSRKLYRAFKLLHYPTRECQTYHARASSDADAPIDGKLMKSAGRAGDSSARVRAYRGVVAKLIFKRYFVIRARADTRQRLGERALSITNCAERQSGDDANH